MDTKCLFGIKEINNKIKIVVIPEDNWLNKKYKYCFNLPQEVIDALDYFGYNNTLLSKDDENSVYIGEFINEYENQSAQEIIQRLNHCSLLEYNEEIDDLLKTYYFYIDKDDRFSEFRIFITSAIHFDSDIIIDEYDENLIEFFKKAGFKKCSNSVFKADSYYYTRIKIDKVLREYKYLKKSFAFTYRCIQRQKTIEKLFPIHKK